MIDYQTFAVELARTAGEVMKKNFSSSMQRTWKSDATPLTATDTWINAYVLQKVKTTFPDHGVIAEEGSDYSENEYVWVCDPVDGTIPFSHGIPLSVFSLALVQDGRPLLGVVYNPFVDRLYTAQKGEGAYMNDETIYVSKTTDLSRGFIDLEEPPFAHNTDGIRQQLRMYGARPLSFASVIYPSMLVAQGEFLATIFPGKNAWDAAAVKIIVEEAGGVVTDLFGNDQRYNQDTNGYVASNGQIHDTLTNIIRSTIHE